MIDIRKKSDLKDYLELAQTEEGFDQYLKEHVYVTKAEAAE